MKLPVRLRTSTVYVAIGVTVLLLCSGVIVKIEGSRRATLAYRYEHIRIGMTAAEVQKLFGGIGGTGDHLVFEPAPDEDIVIVWEKKHHDGMQWYYDGMRMLTFGSDGTLVVTFDTGVVADKRFHAKKEYTFWDHLFR